MCFKVIYDVLFSSFALKLNLCRYVKVRRCLDRISRAALHWVGRCTLTLSNPR